MKYIPTPSYMGGTAYNNAVPLIGGGLGYYNPYMDPRYIRQQQEAERQRQEQEYQNQITVATALFKSANTFNGVETDQDTLNKYFMRPDTTQYQEFLQEQEYQNSLYEIAALAEQQKQYEQQQQEAREREMAELEESHETLYEFLNGSARERYLKVLESRATAPSNIKNLYDKSAYARLLRVQESNPGGMFSALNPLVTIDDMEISLPKSLQNERELKRKQFMESIMAQDRGW